MKLAKKLSAMLISILMVAIMLPTSALADTTAPIIKPSGTTQPVVQDNAPTKGSLTISKVGSASTFKIYKLFSMAVAAGTSKVYSYTPTDAFKNYLPSVTDIQNDNAAALSTLTADLHNKINSKTIVDSTALSQTASNPTNDIYTAEFANIDLGYYLVIETSATNGKVIGNDFLVSVPSVDEGAWNYNVTAKCKDITPPTDKKIVTRDGDQSAGAMTAVKKIGDKVEYRLEANVPQFDVKLDASNIVFRMNDSISKGLDFNRGDMKVYGVTSSGLDTLAGSLFSFQTAPINDTSIENGGNKITIDFTGHYNDIKKYSKIQVFYTATINKDAAIGTQGNPNTYDLTYGENPSNTYTTPPVTPYVYTTGIALKKDDVKDSNVKLEGAVFELKDATGILAVYTYDTDGTTRILASDKGLAKGLSIATDADGMTYFLGLDAGTYTITEKTAPAGYSLLANPVSVVITADTDASGYTGAFHYAIDGGASTLASNNAKSNDILIDVKVSDDQGFTLPGTGGIGTTIFTAVGIAIILLGGFMLLVYTKKKKHSAQH